MSNMAAAPADAGPKKRLVIKKMVLENFKSYAGAQHVGPFHKVGSASSFVRVTRSVRRAACHLLQWLRPMSDATAEALATYPVLPGAW